MKSGTSRIAFRGYGKDTTWEKGFTTYIGTGELNDCIFRFPDTYRVKDVVGDIKFMLSYSGRVGNG